MEALLGRWQWLFMSPIIHSLASTPCFQNPRSEVTVTRPLNEASPWLILVFTALSWKQQIERASVAWVTTVNHSHAAKRRPSSDTFTHNFNSATDMAAATQGMSVICAVVSLNETLISWRFLSFSIVPIEMGLAKWSPVAPFIQPRPRAGYLHRPDHANLF